MISIVGEIDFCNYCGREINQCNNFCQNYIDELNRGNIIKISFSLKSDLRFPFPFPNTLRNMLWVTSYQGKCEICGKETSLEISYRGQFFQRVKMCSVGCYKKYLTWKAENLPLNLWGEDINRLLPLLKKIHLIDRGILRGLF